MVKQPRPEQYAEHQQNMLDDSLLPEEERFDWQTTRALCVGDIRKHKAYGMGIKEYAQRRKEFMDVDDGDKRRLSFYLPSFHAMLSTDMASALDMSTHRFSILIIELGLINFQVDYHDKYQVAKVKRKPLHMSIKTERDSVIYQQLGKQTIGVNSAAGYRQGKCKHSTPYVPMWLYDAVLEVSENLNMTISDLVYVCWCIGISKAMDKNYICELLHKEIDNVMSSFIIELDIYTRRISEIESLLKDDG